jgi:hypothetical protein
VRTTEEADNNVKDADIEDNDDNGKEKQERTTMTARMMKARTMAMTVRTTALMAATATAVVVVMAKSVGEVGGKVGVVGGKVSSVVGGCVLCLMPTHHRNRTDMYRINLFWSKLQFILFGMSGHSE